MVNSTGPRSGRMSALHIAAKRGHVDCIKALLERGADVHSQTVLGRTPLHIVADREDAVEVGDPHAQLIPSWYRPTCRGLDLVTLYLFFAHSIQPELKSITNTDWRECFLELEYASRFTNRLLAAANHQCVTHKRPQALIRGGADAAKMDSFADTPLNVAAANGNGESARALVAAGSDLETVRIHDVDITFSLSLSLSLSLTHTHTHTLPLSLSPPHSITISPCLRAPLSPTFLSPCLPVSYIVVPQSPCLFPNTCWISSG
jgi:hypothetical protein